MTRIQLKAIKGYTLIELLVVLAVLSALSSLALPHFVSYQEKARSARCLSNRYHIDLEERAYFTEHGLPCLIINDLYTCPSGGIYVWLVSDPDDPEYPEIGCSIHYAGLEEPSDPRPEPPVTEPPQPGKKPSESVQELSDYVMDLNLPRNIEKRLTANLKSALKSLQKDKIDQAVNDLNRFIARVKKSEGEEIPSVQADILILRAQDIINAVS